MLSTITFFGGLVLAALSFLFGRFYSQSERILEEKRKLYLDFLSILPPVDDVYRDVSEVEFEASLRPAMERLPMLLFYASDSVTMAAGILLQRYGVANANLNPLSPPLAAEYKSLATARNDLVLEMRRDAFRWSIFYYNGKSRVPAVS